MNTIVIDKDKLRTALAAIAPVIERAHTLLILQCALLEAQGDRLRLTGSRLDQYLDFSADAEIASPVRVCLDFRRLQQIAGVAEGDVRIDVTGTAATLRYDKSRHKLPALPADDYPLPPWAGATSDGVELDGNAVWPLIERVEFCAAKNDIRFYLNGVHLARDSHGLHAVATDGHRIAICSHPDHAGDELALIIPNAIVATLLKLRPPICRVYGNRIEGISERVRIGSQLIDGKFPDWRRVSGNPGTNKAEVDRAAFGRALDRALTCADLKAQGLRLNSADGTLTVTAPGVDVSADVDIAADCAGIPVNWAANGSFLSAAVAQYGQLAGNTDRMALLHTGQPGDPVYIRHTDAQHRTWTQVIMGMRI